MRREDRVAAFDNLYLTYQQPLFAFLYGQTGDRSVAEDLLQQVFVKVWNSIDKALSKPPEALRPWLFTIARNAAIDHLRSSPKTTPLEGERLTDSSNIESQITAKTQLDQISQIVKKMPEEMRTVFTMSILGEMPSEEIGQLLGKPAGTVRYLLSEARKRIRMELGDE